MIEINVNGADIEVKDQLYCNKQGTYMRRDGSIQELKPNEIQDWIRRVREFNFFRQKNLSRSASMNCIEMIMYVVEKQGHCRNRMSHVFDMLAITFFFFY